MDIFAKCFAGNPADQYRAMDLFPYFRELQSRQDVEVIMEGSAGSCSAATTISA